MSRRGSEHRRAPATPHPVRPPEERSDRRGERRAAQSRLVELRPLNPVRSIKLKLGILLVSSGAVGLTYFRYAIGWIPYRTSATAIVLMLITSRSWPTA